MLIFVDNNSLTFKDFFAILFIYIAAFIFLAFYLLFYCISSSNNYL
jgi:hypothetical protein